MSITKPNDLFSHVGHRIEAVKYGDTERAIECINCGEVLADEESQTEAQMNALWFYYSDVTPGHKGWTKLKKAFGWKANAIKLPAGYVPAAKKAKTKKEAK